MERSSSFYDSYAGRFAEYITDYYEAADIDGANGWQKFWHITLPLLKPILAINVMFSLISNIYSFNIVSMMFGNGAGIPGEWGIF